MIEMSMALVMIAIVIVLAIPSLTGYQNTRNLDMGAQQFIGILRGALDESRTQHFLFRITFSLNNGTFPIDQWTPTSGLVSDRCNIALMAGGGGSWYTVENDVLPTGLTVTSTPGINPIIFSCLGTPYDSTGAAAGGAQTIVISNSAGSRTITIGTDSNVQCPACAY